MSRLLAGEGGGFLRSRLHTRLRSFSQINTAVDAFSSLAPIGEHRPPHTCVKHRVCRVPYRKVNLIDIGPSIDQSPIVRQRVVLEVFGAPGTVATITYLDLNAFTYCLDKSG